MFSLNLPILRSDPVQDDVKMRENYQWNNIVDDKLGTNIHVPISIELGVNRNYHLVLWEI